MNIQKLYNQVQIGEISKSNFLSEIRKDNRVNSLFTNTNTFEQIIYKLKAKSIISESINKEMFDKYKKAVELYLINKYHLEEETVFEITSKNINKSLLLNGFQLDWSVDKMASKLKPEDENEEEIEELNEEDEIDYNSGTENSFILGNEDEGYYLDNSAAKRFLLNIYSKTKGVGEIDWDNKKELSEIIDDVLESDGVTDYIGVDPEETEEETKRALKVEFNFWCGEYHDINESKSLNEGTWGDSWRDKKILSNALVDLNKIYNSKNNSKSRIELIDQFQKKYYLTLGDDKFYDMLDNSKNNEYKLKEVIQFITRNINHINKQMDLNESRSTKKEITKTPDQVNYSEYRMGISKEYTENKIPEDKVQDVVLKNLTKDPNYYTNLLSYGKGDQSSKKRTDLMTLVKGEKDYKDKDNEMKVLTKNPKDDNNEDTTKKATNKPKGVTLIKKPSKKYTSLNEMVKGSEYGEKKSTTFSKTFTNLTSQFVLFIQAEGGDFETESAKDENGIDFYIYKGVNHIGSLLKQKDGSYNLVTDSKTVLDFKKLLTPKMYESSLNEIHNEWFIDDLYKLQQTKPGIKVTVNSDWSPTGVKKVEVTLLSPFKKDKINPDFYQAFCNYKGKLEVCTIDYDSKEAFIGGNWEDGYDENELDNIAVKYNLVRESSLNETITENIGYKIYGLGVNLSNEADKDWNEGDGRYESIKDNLLDEIISDLKKSNFKYKKDSNRYDLFIECNWETVDEVEEIIRTSIPSQYIDDIHEFNEKNSKITGNLKENEVSNTIFNKNKSLGNQVSKLSLDNQSEMEKFILNNQYLIGGSWVDYTEQDIKSFSKPELESLYKKVKEKKLEFDSESYNNLRPDDYVNEIMDNNDPIARGDYKKEEKEARGIFNILKQHELIDDRREYDIEDLQNTYSISLETAKILYSLIHSIKENANLDKQAVENEKKATDSKIKALQARRRELDQGKAVNESDDEQETFDDKSEMEENITYTKVIYDKDTGEYIYLNKGIEVARWDANGDRGYITEIINEIQNPLSELVKIEISLMDAKKSQDIFNDERWKRFGIEQETTNTYSSDDLELMDDFANRLESIGIEVIRHY